MQKVPPSRKLILSLLNWQFANEDFFFVFFLFFFNQDRQSILWLRDPYRVLNYSSICRIWVFLPNFLVLALRSFLTLHTLATTASDDRLVLFWFDRISSSWSFSSSDRSCSVGLRIIWPKKPQCLTTIRVARLRFLTLTLPRTVLLLNLRWRPTLNMRFLHRISKALRCFNQTE